MKQIIYVDVLLAVNLFINYFILLATEKFLKLPFRKRKIFLGAFLGAAFSLYIFVPVKSAALSVIIKLLMASALVLFTFFPNSFRLFLKELACFFSINFAFAGLMFALWYFAAPPGLTVNNGVVYFNISPMLLIGMTLFCYLVIRLISRLTGREVYKGESCVVTVILGGKKTEILTKVDTGNELKEPFSGLPVVVTSYEKIEKLIPEQLRPFFRGEPGDLKQEFPQSTVLSGLSCRMIPCHTVSGEGILPAFCPDRLVIRQGEKVREQKAYIAVGNLFRREAYDALIGPELL